MEKQSDLTKKKINKSTRWPTFNSNVIGKYSVNCNVKLRFKHGG